MKRYDLEPGPIWPVMYEREGGDWVRYEDAAAELAAMRETEAARREALRQIFSALGIEMVADYSWMTDEACDRITAMRERTRWIPVGERLPTKPGDYECVMLRKATGDRWLHTETWYEVGTHRDQARFGGQCREIVVTHWREIDLPEGGA